MATLISDLGRERKPPLFARRLFLRLTEFGEGTEDTRRRASLDDCNTRCR